MSRQITSRLNITLGEKCDSGRYYPAGEFNYAFSKALEGGKLFVTFDDMAIEPPVDLTKVIGVVVGKAQTKGTTDGFSVVWNLLDNAPGFIKDIADSCELCPKMIGFVKDDGEATDLKIFSFQLSHSCSPSSKRRQVSFLFISSLGVAILYSPVTLCSWSL